MFNLFNLFWFMILIFDGIVIIILMPVVIIKCTRKAVPRSAAEQENGINTQPNIIKSSRQDKNDDATDISNKSERDGKKLELSNIRDSIRVAKINQQRNSPKNKDKKGGDDEPVKATKMIYTKSASQSQSIYEKSACEGSSIKFISAESLTDEIVVPVGKTSRAPVPQSSLTSLNNLKTHGQPKSEAVVKFGDERISTKRTKPLSEAI